MTWVEVLPALGITTVLGLSLIECVKFFKRADYRGIMDGRVGYLFSLSFVYLLLTNIA